MPEIQTFFFNDVSYSSASYTSLWFNVSSSKAFTFTVFCSSDCDIVIEEAIDDGYQIICSKISSHIGGNVFSVTKNTGLAFVRLSVINIVSLPCNLKVQGYFYLDNC